MEDISIHALREEGDLPSRTIQSSALLFLSTPSARRATHNNFAQRIPVIISIHALREEGDLSRTLLQTSTLYFYPRPPRGGRQEWADKMGIAKQFLSTPSARRATGQHSGAKCYHDISIHALREEGDKADTEVL